MIELRYPSHLSTSSCLNFPLRLTDRHEDISGFIDWCLDPQKILQLVLGMYFWLTASVLNCQNTEKCLLFLSLSLSLTDSPSFPPPTPSLFAPTVHTDKQICWGCLYDGWQIYLFLATELVTQEWTTRVGSGATCWVVLLHFHGWVTFWPWLDWQSDRKWRRGWK